MKEKADITKLSKSANILFESYSRALLAAAKHIGITKSEADIIVFFSGNPDCFTTDDIRKYRGYTEDYINDAVNRLCKNGLIETDGNKISVTGKGGIIGIALKNAEQRFFDSLLTGISSDEHSQFDKMISKICENAEKLR